MPANCEIRLFYRRLYDQPPIVYANPMAGNGSSSTGSCVAPSPEWRFCASASGAQGLVYKGRNETSISGPSSRA